MTRTDQSEKARRFKPYSDPRDSYYENKRQEVRLMRIDPVHPYGSKMRLHLPQEVTDMERISLYSTQLKMKGGMENIPKTSAMPHESFPRVTSLGGDEGSLKQKLKELMEFCTTLQSQQTQMAEKIQSQDLEIKQLKARIQTLEDAQKPREGVQEDAPNRGGIDQGEVNVFKGDLTNVIEFMGAGKSYIASGGDTTPYTRRPRASREVVIRSTSPIPISIPSAGKEDKRKGKEIMTEPEKPAKAKVQEQMSSIYDGKFTMDCYGNVCTMYIRVGQAPKVYPYFESMLKDFNRDDLVTLWKLVKDMFKTELPKSDLEKCLFWPLKVMFEPVSTDLLWQFKAPIKSWKIYKSCKVHCLSMEGMIIYMLDDVEYPF
ncbi:hypothetical protein Tco_0248271 [Tanacetum coccineum]